MHTNPLQRWVGEAIGKGLAYLIECQSNDGLWRDYDLKRGQSEAFSTAWVGWCLTHFVNRATCMCSIRKAAVALGGVGKPTGWGFNRHTETDADSTAWTVRFLCGSGVNYGRAMSARLQDHVNPAGQAHTFLDPARGSWADAHADVTPVVGLALLACGAQDEVIQRIRAAVVSAWKPGNMWKSFWWATDVYATLWSAVFLRESGGVPEEIRRELESGVLEGHGGDSPLEIALSLLLCLEVTLDGGFVAEALVHQLADSFVWSSWPGSALLLVPRQYENDPLLPVGPHADVRGLLTTAMACVALARWLEGATRFCGETRMTGKMFSMDDHLMYSLDQIG